MTTTGVVGTHGAKRPRSHVLYPSDECLSVDVNGATNKSDEQHSLTCHRSHQTSNTIDDHGYGRVRWGCGVHVREYGKCPPSNTDPQQGMKRVRYDGGASDI